MSISQNGGSQQTILEATKANIDIGLDEISYRITNGCMSLAHEYTGYYGKEFNCFSYLDAYKTQIAHQCAHQPQVYLPIALSTLTAILQKSLEFTAHYICLSAQPNANKTTTLNTISNTLNVLGINQSPQWPRSYPALYQQLQATNGSGIVMLVDEMFKKFRACYVEKDRVDGEVFEKIVSLYESSDFQAPLVKVDKSRAPDDEERKNIKHVRFSLLGTGTDGEFQQILKSSQFTDSGWLSRMGVFRLRQSREVRSVSKMLQTGKNHFKLSKDIYDINRLLHEWASKEIRIKALKDNDINDKDMPRRFVKLKFFCPEAEKDYLSPSGTEEYGNPWDDSMLPLVETIKKCTDFFKKSGHTQFAGIWEELAGDRLYKKASYYAQLLWLTDAILCPGSPMAYDLNKYLQQVIGMQDAIYLPYTYFDMGIQIVRLMVLNLFEIMVEGLGEENGTDFDIQSAIMRIYYTHPQFCTTGLSPTDIVRHITNQYRSTFYRQARRDNLEELCYSGYLAPAIDKNQGKPYRGARYVPTQAGLAAFLSKS